MVIDWPFAKLVKVETEPASTTKSYEPELVDRKQTSKSPLAPTPVLYENWACAAKADRTEVIKIVPLIKMHFSFHVAMTLEGGG